VNKYNRREFGACLGATAALAASDRVRVALIGAGGRGRDLVRNAAAVPGVELAVVCDPDRLRRDRMAELAATRTGRRPETEVDLRRVFERRDIDAVVLTCPNHWHALATVWAVEAGKHVYVEKPVSHSPAEGWRMVEAARKHRCVVQGGTQRRSSERFRKAVEYLHSGGIGDVYQARWLFTGPRDSIGIRQPEPPPAELDWDLWLGPAPSQPFHRNLVHYNWHWFWDFGNGEMGNNGVHYLDVVRWGMKRGVPRRIYSTGGRFGYRDQAQTPNTQSALYEYDDGAQIVCEIRGLYSNEEVGMRFYGTRGTMHLDRVGNFRVFAGRATAPGLVVEQGDAGEAEEVGHFRNFIDALRAGNPSLLACDIAEAADSTMLAHLANISYRLKREVRFDAAARRFANDAEADALLDRPARAPFTMPARS
jgi:predicted dehydrogenase